MQERKWTPQRHKVMYVDKGFNFSIHLAAASSAYNQFTGREICKTVTQHSDSHIYLRRCFFSLRTSEYSACSELSHPGELNAICSFFLF
jgi:trehalose-6-phosphatase